MISKDVPRLSSRYDVAGATLDFEVPVKGRFGRTRTEIVTTNILDLSVTGALVSISAEEPFEVGDRRTFRRGDAVGRATVRHLRLDESKTTALCGICFISMDENMERIIHEAIGKLRNTSRVVNHWELNR